MTALLAKVTYRYKHVSLLRDTEKVNTKATRRTAGIWQTPGKEPTPELADWRQARFALHMIEQGQPATELIDELLTNLTRLSSRLHLRFHLLVISDQETCFSFGKA